MFSVFLHSNYYSPRLCFVGSLFYWVLSKWINQAVPKTKHGRYQRGPKKKIESRISSFMARHSSLICLLKVKTPPTVPIQIKIIAVIN
jgi:hypothetical protein